MSDYESVKLYRVSIRRDIGRQVRPEAEQIDGKVFYFYRGWFMDKNDPYPFEFAMIPLDWKYPRSAPTWIASGDLKLVEAQV